MWACVPKTGCFLRLKSIFCPPQQHLTNYSRRFLCSYFKKWVPWQQIREFPSYSQMPSRCRQNTFNIPATPTTIFIQIEAHALIVAQTLYHQDLRSQMREVTEEIQDFCIEKTWNPPFISDALQFNTISQHFFEELFFYCHFSDLQ